MERPDIRSREQKYKDGRRNRMFVERTLIESIAFRELKTPAAYVVLFRLLSKCQWEKAQARPGTRDKCWLIANNGRIQFSYTEANRIGITDKMFTRAVDELVRVGFIDIEHTGYGLRRDRTLYSVSSRWKAFGTEAFEIKSRPRRGQKIGFQQGNRHGGNNTRKKKTTALEGCCSTALEGCC